MGDQAQLALLEERIRDLLPEDYAAGGRDVLPTPMGSAGLRFGGDGMVAWNEIWQSFCDLAMAGGPPHKGTLLEPATPSVIQAEPDRHREVVQEICRGVRLATGLPAQESPAPGWVRVSCRSEGMAAWLFRAIVMENVAARAGGRALDLPASPRFRLEKEIKNVVTVIAKTTHYWVSHTSRSRQREIGRILAEMDDEAPLVEPDGWRGVECPTVGAAIWMMRALVATNVLARREDTTLFVPVNSVQDPGAHRVSAAVTRIRRLAQVKGLWSG